MFAALFDEPFWILIINKPKGLWIEKMMPRNLNE